MSFRIKLILPILLILTAAFLRLYKFEEFVTFLGDQGRDAIVLKRIVTFEHFPAIGAPSSLGQIFLGPFYYYLIAPFLLLFSFNPVGPAFGVAFLSILGIFVLTFIVNKEINFKTAILFLIFISFSAVNVQFSRFSWNPNLLPIFSFLTLYFLYKLATENNKLYAVLFGAFLSFSVQLHHLALLLFLPVVIVFILQMVKNYKTTASRSFNFLISIVSYLFFSLPLFIFDLRHQFLNSKNLLKLFAEGNPTDHEGFLSRFLETNQAFYNHIFQTNINQYLAISAISVSIVLFFFLLNKFKSKKYFFLLINLLSLISYLLSFSVFNTSRNAHYYGSIYLSFFLILAWLLANITKNKFILFSVSLLVLTPYFFFNIKSLNYLFSANTGSQIKNAEIVANSILKENPDRPYQTVALPNVETDGHIRYFLEIKEKRPLPSDTLEEPKELYVLCFEKECNVLGNPQWQIAAFKQAKIDKIWTVAGVKIYKLIHQITRNK